MNAIRVIVDHNGATVDGQAVPALDGQSMHEAAIHHVARVHAAPIGKPIEIVAQDSSGATSVLVHPDGTTSGHTPYEARPHLKPVANEEPQPTAADDQPTTRAQIRASATFLAPHDEIYPEPSGFRGFLHRLGFTQQPSEAEKRTRTQERAVSQLWPGTRTIAVVNGKGGAGKTPTTVLLSAIFARYGGSGVLAWDCNATRGTLGWRTEQGPHESTVLDLLPHVDELLAPSARAADLAAYVHHQTGDKFDVLRSNPLLLSTEQKITPQQLDAVHDVAAKYYRMLVMDSGNDEGDSLWLRMIDHADQLVVPTSTRADHAEAARLLLDALHERDDHSARLAESAVVVVSQADRDEKDAETIAKAFRGLVNDVVTVPYDPALRQQWLRYDGLATSTQAAYLSVAAAIARNL